MNLAEFMASHRQGAAATLAPRLLRQLAAFRLSADEAALMARPDLPLPPSVKQRLDRDVADILAGKPLAYVFGRAPFVDWDFLCDERALSPRPETEALCHDLIQSYRGLSAPLRIADLCCGGGVMGLSLALAFPQARVTLADLSEPALALCAENAALHGLEGRVRLLAGHLWEPFTEDDRFDLVVSNPPYVATDDEVQPSVLAHEPALALFSEDAGMAHFKEIVLGLDAHLAPGGRAAFELGHRHHRELKPWLEAQPFAGAWHWQHDPFGVPRFLMYTASAPVRQGATPMVGKET